MNRTLQGKRILITGVSSGIGRGLAIEALKRNANVLGVGRNQERLSETASMAKEFNGAFETITGDVTNPDDRERILDYMHDRFDGIDILVNNAGIGATGHFQYAEEERLRKIMEVNFFAVAELTRLAIPMLKHGNDPTIVNISSVAGRRGIASRVEYSASKFALTGFSEALRAELAKDDIDLTVINPGLTESSFESNMLENKARHSLHSQRSMTSAECAQLTWDAVCKRKNEVTFTRKGKTLVLAAKFLPRFVDFKMAKIVRELYKEEIEERKQGKSKVPANS